MSKINAQMLVMLDDLEEVVSGEEIHDHDGEVIGVIDSDEVIKHESGQDVVWVNFPDGSSSLVQVTLNGGA